MKVEINKHVHQHASVHLKAKKPFIFMKKKITGLKVASKHEINCFKAFLCSEE